MFNNNLLLCAINTKTPSLKSSQHRCSPPLWRDRDSPSVALEHSGDQLRGKFWRSPLIHMGDVVRSTPACRARDMISSPGPGEDFSLKLMDTVMLSLSS